MKKIYVCLVHVIPTIENHPILEDGLGAYVQIALKAKGLKDFVKRTGKLFAKHELQLEDGNDFKPMSKVKRKSKRYKLCKKVEKGAKFAWGTFHIYLNDDGTEEEHEEPCEGCEFCEDVEVIDEQKED